MLQCYNRGCGKTFDPDHNDNESCCHHPGAPYFHDAYKGWSCCNKKSVDFTEFLSIKGCTLSKHSNVKPPEPEKPPKNADDGSDKDEVIEVRAPITKPIARPSIETTMTDVSATIAPALKETIDNLRSSAPVKALKDVNTSNEVTKGTSCKNSGCFYEYSGTPQDTEECCYHPGVPIFHEGMKFWSCCQKRTSDFAVFMAQKGCAYGQHKWFKEDDDKKVVQCRYDWHQTASNVIVSIYAKMYHYEKSIIEVNPIRLHVSLVFPEQEGAKFELDIELRGVIDAAKTSAHMYGSKVEITMPKAEPGSWPKLDFPRTTKMPPTKPAGDSRLNQNKEDPDSEEDEFDLDDLEPVQTGMRLSELASEQRKDFI